MRDPIILLVHLIATLARLMGPGGLRSVVAESVLVKQQLLILNRSRHRAPNLCASDRTLAGVCALFMRPTRVIRSAIVLRPSTILEFHRALRTRKYRWLFSPKRRRTGPQGPSKALVDAIVDMKRRNPRWGCPRIAQQIALAFAVDIDKDVVRRVLATHYRPAPHSGGPSWLTFLGHAKDSLWSIDLFRCESAILRSHWVLVVMDQYTRRIVGFGIHAGTVDGRALCRKFNHAIRGLSRPKRLSSDHDPLYRFHQWRANLRVLQVTEVKSVPYVPLSHPFVERLIGTLRRECVDQLLFWSASDLEDKLVAFQDFYNAHRAHASLDGRTPVPIREGCRTARPLPMGRALPWSLSDADRGVTSDQRRRWRAGRRARVRRLSRHSRAVRQLHALLMPSRQLRGGLPAHGTRRSNDVGFLRIRHPQVGGGRPFGPTEVEAMKDAHSISTRRAYGVQRVCRVWRRARSSVYARRQATTSRAPCRRRGPVGAAPDDVLAGHIRRLLEASPFHGEGYRKAWAKLRVAGIRTSPERVRRLMREHDLQAPHRVGHAHGPKAHDGTITTAAPDVMWGTDMTATVTVGEGAAFVFVAVDHCTTECIGLHAAKRGTRFEALEPIRQGVRARFGTIGEGVARGLRLRHDHGSNYLADDFQQEVAFFGIESSPSFVREPEGNGVAERFIRTLKENLLWVRSFDTIEELRLALLEFKRTYNEQWMLEKYHYQSPAQVRRDFVGLDAAA